MVGTKLMRLFSWRARANAARSWAIECNVFMVSELVLGRREFNRFHGCHISAQGRLDIRLTGHEVLHELGHATVERQAEHVMHYQHLTVGIRPSADTNNRNIH